MGTKGVLSKRGKGELYDEPKSQQVLVTLTPTGLKKLNNKIRSYRDKDGNALSRSEYIERLARDIL
ncbi:MAG: hypothetical protein WBA57_21300 [Elainellaceae cyanobacterium]